MPMSITSADGFNAGARGGVLMRRYARYEPCARRLPSTISIQHQHARVVRANVFAHLPPSSLLLLLLSLLSMPYVTYVL